MDAMLEGINETRRIEVNPANMLPVTPIPHLNLPDIKELACHEYVAYDRIYYVFDCVPSSEKTIFCPCCKTAMRKHGYLPEPRKIHDVNCGIHMIDILLKVPRYLCEQCGASTTHPFESIVEKRQMTRRLYDQIRRDAFLSTFVDVAADYGYSDTTITNIFDEYAEELEARRKQVVAPRVLGIDEKHIVNEARGMFVDIETGILLEMTEDNKRHSIISAIESFKDYDKNIKIVTIDMAEGYRSYIHECLPNAVIVIDKFHVFKEMHEIITTAKTQILEYIKDKVKTEPYGEDRESKLELLQMIYHNPYLFKFGPEKLQENPERLGKLTEACKGFPELNHLRLLKEGFELIYDCSDRDSANAVFENWQKYIPPTGARQIEQWEAQYNVPAYLYEGFRRIKNTMTRLQTEIFNYFDYGNRYTNAATEGLNQLTDKMNRMGNGYSFKRLRARALFWHIAAPRISFSLKSKKVPVYKAVQSEQSYPTYEDLLSGSFTATHSFADYGIRRHEEEEEFFVTQTSLKEPKRNQLSVFSYLPPWFR